ncbi:MAG TPA: nitroreductase family protein [Negativicutes bacterium]|jgi:nitroreductase/NAD-dependent dihydropyrimidine dehydrogenase PreA subunit
MELIKVDQTGCIQCGICVKVCPASVLSMGENGPEAIAPQACVACGHCVAVCPQTAIDNTRTPLANQIELPEFPVLTATVAQQFLRSRRSIRCYRQTAVPREQLLQLIDIARFAPTGSNSQGVSYIIIEDRKILNKVIEVTIEWMEEQIQSNPSVHWSFPYHVQAYRETGIDKILRGAPHLLLATTRKDLQRGRENTIFSFAYLELFATALGLGSCWAGLFEMCVFAKHYPLLQLFNIQEDKVITGAVMVGYPEYSYQRLVDRNPLDVSWL